MTEDQSTPDDAQRPDGEPRFSFTDKRKVNPEDGNVRSSGGTPAPEGQGSSEPVDPIDAEAAKLYEQAEQGEAGSVRPTPVASPSWRARSPSSPSSSSASRRSTSTRVGASRLRPR